MNSDTDDQVKGKYHEVKSKVQVAAGERMDDPSMEVMGTSEKAAGKAQNKVAESACSPGCGCMLGFRRA